MLALFVQVTVSPALTNRFTGTKAKLTIETELPALGVGVAVAAGVDVFVGVAVGVLLDVEVGVGVVDGVLVGVLVGGTPGTASTDKAARLLPVLDSATLPV